MWETYTLKGYKTKPIKYAYLAAMQRLGKAGSLMLSIASPLSLVTRTLKCIIIERAFLDGIEGLEAALAYIAYLQSVDLLKAFRPSKWDKIAEMVNTCSLTFLCKPASCLEE